MPINILTTIADNPALLEAVREVIEAQFEPDTTRSDDTITDLQLGQMYRARLVGLQKIDKAFKEIEKHKTSRQPVPIGRNPAR